MAIRCVCVGECHLGFKKMEKMLKLLRTFRDKKGMYFPSNADVIVIVAKTNPGPREVWFPFELRLEFDLTVDVHGLLGRVSRLLPRTDKHEGWRFQIKGNFFPEKAQKAKTDCQIAEESGRIPEEVGLRAAVKLWMSARDGGRS
jgi:hypothetical protein